MGDRSNYQARMVAQRELEARRESLQRAMSEDSRVKQVNIWQGKSAAQRHAVRSAELEAERAREEELSAAEAETRRRAREAAQESKLAEEIRLKKQEDRADASRIELIVQSDPRLREIQRKLKTLYITKERAEQLHSKAVHEFNSKKEEAEMERAMLQAMSAYAEQVAAQERSRKEWVEASKAELLRQMSEKRQLNRAQAAEEHQKDRDDVDRILQQIMREEQEAFERKTAKQNETRELLQKYQQQHEAEKQARAAAERAMEQKIAAYQESVYARGEAEAAKKAEEAARQQRIYEEIMRQQEEMRRRENELLDVRETLSMEEVELREQRKEKERAERIRRMRQEMIEANEAQKHYKSEQQQREALVELEIRQRMLQKYEEDYAKERAQAEQRRRDMLSHKEAIEGQKAARFEAFRQAQEQEKEAARRQVLEDEFRERVVREAAKRLLEQHKDVIETYGAGVRGFQL